MLWEEDFEGHKTFHVSWIHFHSFCCEPLPNHTHSPATFLSNHVMRIKRVEGSTKLKISQAWGFVTWSYDLVSWREEMILTLFPSRSKWVKLRVILYWGGAIISQMQFLFAGYKSGNDGDTIDPFDASMIPPQASSHFLPSEWSSYPMRHSHLYPPSVLTHSCSHPWFCSEHSSNSFMKFAENPAFWTEESETNLTIILLELDLTSSGTLYPQYFPMMGDVGKWPSLTSRKSYTQLSWFSISKDWNFSATWYPSGTVIFQTHSLFGL